VPPGALAAARELADNGEPGARRVSTASGENYVLFVTRPPGPRPAPRPGPPPPIAPWEFIVIGIATSLAFSALLAWYLARPIRNLRWAFDAAAAGRLETRVSPRMGRRRDEIADLGRDFDRMATQLQKLVSAQRRLLHDVSHELRSPLARLEAAIGLARQDPARVEASLERIEREAARLDELVGEVLTLARLESRSERSLSESVDFAELAAAIAEDGRFEAEANNRRLRLEAPDRLIVTGNPELLHRAVENVVRNAVKYTAEGSEVLVRLEQKEDLALLQITDHGPGIPERELARVFEPFYRVGNEERKGFGLGLAIAQLAVQAHGGSIHAANAPGGGLRVEIGLPLGTMRQFKT
jgi:two-component system OmpR family sensor kinase